ncbi:MAG: ATP-binding protein, partial [Thermodesulfobacteriota bacterium]
MLSAKAEDLSQCKALADVLVRNMADGIIAVNARGEVILINDAATKITRLSEKEAIGKGIEEVFCYPGSKERNPLLMSLTGGEVQLDHNFNLITSTGERLPLSVACTPILDKKGKVSGCVAVFRDVTELREIENMKTEFVSTVSHELRTPLTSIKGSIGLILGGVAGEVNDEVAELLTIAQNNTDRLIRLINEMLDVSKIESGKIQMNKESLAVDTLVKKALERIKGYANECQVKLKCQLPEQIPLVLADRDRIEQVITNLLSNAIKFTPAGGVVTLEVTDESESVNISVADTGIGIPEGQLEKIFDKFHQVDQSTIRQKGGTGLGLSICYAIVSEHGGKIWAESTEGEGSSFNFTLPKLERLGKVRAEEGEASLLARLEEFQERVRHRQETKIEGKTVLICDDDPTAVRELKGYLEKEGFYCIEAYSGREALEIAKRTKVDA